MIEGSAFFNREFVSFTSLESDVHFGCMEYLYLDDLL